MKEAMLCVDVRLIQASGIGTYLKSILPELKDSILLHWKKDREFLLQYAPRELIEVKSPLYSLREQFELPLKIPRCDLFWSPHFNIPLLPLRAKKRLTTIFDLFFLANQCSFAQKNYAKLLYKSACRLSDHIITSSEFSKAEILRYCQPKHLSLIKLGVSPHFSPCPNQKVLEKYGLPANYILTVSNGKPHKNIDRLVQACVGLDQKLVLVGKELYIEDSDLPAVYSGASLFVFPSTYEGFGLPPLEAMACGSPVVVSNVASLPEVCGNAAEYVDPYSVQSIRKGILSALERRDELIQLGFEHVRKRSARECTLEHLALIKEMVCKEVL